jgi:hypothetical protein
MFHLLCRLKCHLRPSIHGTRGYENKARTHCKEKENAAYSQAHKAMRNICEGILSRLSAGPASGRSCPVYPAQDASFAAPVAIHQMHGFYVHNQPYKTPPYVYARQVRLQEVLKGLQVSFLK